MRKNKTQSFSIEDLERVLRFRISSNPELISRLQRNPKIKYSEKKRIYQFRPLHDIFNRIDLMNYLKRHPSQGLKVCPELVGERSEADIKNKVEDIDRKMREEIWQSLDDVYVRGVRASEAKRKIQCLKCTWPAICPLDDRNRCRRCYDHLDGVCLVALAEKHCEEVCNSEENEHFFNTVECDNGFGAFSQSPAKPKVLPKSAATGADQAPVKELSDTTLEAWQGVLKSWFETPAAPAVANQARVTKKLNKRKANDGPRRRVNRVANTHLIDASQIA